jgi:hypothetical protein
MAKAKKKTGLQAMSVMASLPPLASRRGLPAADSVVAVTPPGPSGLAAKLTVIHTNEVDIYEKGALAPGLAPAAHLAALPPGDNFTGTSRKASKLSISAAQIEKFNNVADLIKTLPGHQEMVKHKPKITTTASSKRVKEEDRNVRAKAFMYAASREDDNDFHLIIGMSPSATQETYMTMELSGLPPGGSASFPQLKAARDAFKKFFKDVGKDPPGRTYDFYLPPIAVTIDGSLFFDMSHATGSRPGPASLKSRMPVVWEVHPITRIVLKLS